MLKWDVFCLSFINLYAFFSFDNVHDGLLSFDVFQTWKPSPFVQGQLQESTENVVYTLHPRDGGSQHRISHELDEHPLAASLMMSALVDQGLADSHNVMRTESQCVDSL